MADNQRGIKFFSKENVVDRNSGLELQQENEKRKAIKAGAEELAARDKANLMSMTSKALVGRLFNWTGNEIDRTGNNYKEQQMAEARNKLDQQTSSRWQKEDEQTKAAMANFDKLMAEEIARDATAKEDVSNMQQKAGVIDNFKQQPIDEQARGVLTEMAGSQAVTNELERGVAAKQNSEAEQAEVDALNNTVEQVMNVQTGSSDGVIMTNVAQVREPEPILPQNSETRKANSEFKETKPATVGKEQSDADKEEQDFLKGFARFKKAGRSMADKNRVIAAGKGMDTAEQELDAAIKIAETNRAIYTANGDPLLVAAYNRLVGTTDPDVSNALAKYKESIAKYNSEITLYNNELVNNRELYEQYMKGKEEAIRTELIPRITAASGITDPELKYVDAAKYEKMVTEQQKKNMEEFAKTQRAAFEKNEPIDPSITGTVISNTIANQEAGKLSIHDANDFLTGIAARIESFNSATRKMNTRLRNDTLGPQWSEDAYRAAVIAANDQATRQKFIKLAMLNDNLPKEQQKGLNFMRTAFNVADVKRLANAFLTWENEDRAEKASMVRVGKVMQEQYRQLPEPLRNAIITNSPGKEGVAIDELTKGILVTPEDANALEFNEKAIMESDKVSPLAKAAIQIRQGRDFNSLSSDIVEGVIEENILNNGMFKAFGSNTFSNAVNEVRSSLSAFDAILALQNTDSADTIKAKFMEAQETYSKATKGRDFLTAVFTQQDAKMLKDAMSMEKMDRAAIMEVLSASKNAVKSARTNLFRSALNRVPKTYANGKVDNSSGSTYALIGNSCNTVFKELVSTPENKQLMLTPGDSRMVVQSGKDILRDKFMNEMLGTKDNIAALIAVGISKDILLQMFEDAYKSEMKAIVVNQAMQQQAEQNLALANKVGVR